MEDTTVDDTSSSFDLDISNVGSSTPVNSSFLSPIKKLDKLHLHNLSDINEEDVGNKTIINSSDGLESSPVNDHGNDHGDSHGSEHHEISNQVANSSDDSDANDSDANEYSNEHLINNPTYVNKRKRETSDIDIDMMTPDSNEANFSHSGINLNNADSLRSSLSSRSMSICSNNNNSNITSTSLSNLKLSFSNSDSTPCPLPAKKKLKFKEHTLTPINTKKKLLNFSNSIKTNVQDMNSVPPYNDNDNDNDLEDDAHSSPIQTVYKAGIQSTPISQSTPSNSRLPSPILEPQQPHTDVHSEQHSGDEDKVDNEVVDEADEDMEDLQSESYTETPVQPQRYSTPGKVPPLQQTPSSTVRPTSRYPAQQTPIITELQASINGYKLINKEVEYEIIDDLDVNHDTHIADQRIEISEEDDRDEEEANSQWNPRVNDPYLKEPESGPSDGKLQLRSQYMASKTQLPLLQEVPAYKDAIMELITNENILKFYEYIVMPQESLTDLLRQERIKWHPDKWVNNTSVDISIVESVSKSINSLLEEG